MKKHLKIKNINLLFLIKAGIGSAIAIIVAQSLGLLYSPSAGIITLLTLQNTKKETIVIAVKRILSFILATVIAFLSFETMGYHSIAFGVFVFLFVAMCILFRLKDGISMNAVLMTHFLVEKRFDFPLIRNEVGILMIGMVIGIMLNLIMPKNRARIRKEQMALEDEFRNLLHELKDSLANKDACYVQGMIGGKPDDNLEDNSQIEDSSQLQIGASIRLKLETSNQLQIGASNQLQLETSNRLKNKFQVEDGFPLEVCQQLKDKSNRIQQDTAKMILQRENDFKKNDSKENESLEKSFERLDHMLERLLQKAYEEADNTLLTDTRYMISYLQMRKVQSDVLKSISKNIRRIPVILSQTKPIVQFMGTIADSFHELNNAKALLEELHELYQYFRDDKLPNSREEFEYRAILFQILNELEYFLVMKRNFIIEIEKKDLKKYWE